MAGPESRAALLTWMNLRNLAVGASGGDGAETSGESGSTARSESSGGESIECGSWDTVKVVREGAEEG